MMATLFASVVCKITEGVEGKGLHSNLTQLRFFVNLFINYSFSYGNNNFIYINRSVCSCVIQSYISVILNIVTSSVSHRFFIKGHFQYCCTTVVLLTSYSSSYTFMYSLNVI
jgi:hypothetical protein